MKSANVPTAFCFRKVLRKLQCQINTALQTSITNTLEMLYQTMRPLGGVFLKPKQRPYEHKISS